MGKVKSRHISNTLCLRMVGRAGITPLGSLHAGTWKNPDIHGKSRLEVGFRWL